MNNRLIETVVNKVYYNIENLQEKKKKSSKKKKKSFPDLTGDGKVTYADILKGRRVIDETEEMDEFVEELDERKKRRKRRKKRKSPKPNKYQKSKYKASGKRGKTMAKATQAYNAAKKAGRKPPKWIYKARDDSEAKERKKKGYKSKPRFDTGMYLSEAKKEN